METSVELAYGGFLRRVATTLATVGAQPLLTAEGGQGAPWTAGWDLILLADTAGASTLYAFAEAGAGKRVLQEHVDRLAGGLAQANLLSAGQINLVAVVAFHGDTEPEARRLAGHLAPSTYFPGLRPYAWAVDLDAGKVYAGRSLGQPEGREMLEAAARASASLDDAQLSTAAARHVEQLSDFRELMQGRQPLATYTLIALNVLMYLAVSLAPGGYDQNLPTFGALIPHLVQQGEWWRLVAAMFLHANVAHILFNMTSLFVVGSLAERLYGSRKFVAIYLGSGLIASLCGFGFSVFNGDLYSPHVGASGAIFGIAGALMTIRFQRSDVIPMQLRRRISSSMFMLVAINLVVLSFTPNIDNAAHVGGLLGGIILSFAFPLTKQLPEKARWS